MIIASHCFYVQRCRTSYLNPSGSRPQAYVQNPLEWVDPLGLAECPKVSNKNSVATPAHNAVNFVKHKELLSVTESANPLVESLRTTGQLPSNYVNKDQAIQQGWKPGKALNNSVPGGQIGVDVFQNSTNILPSEQGRIWQ